MCIRDRVKEILKDGVIVETSDGKTQKISADSVILSVGYHSMPLLSLIHISYTINGRTDDSIEVISPIVGGIISNYTMAEHIPVSYTHLDVYKRQVERSL